MSASSCVTFTFQRGLFYHLLGRSPCRYQGDRLVWGFAFPKCTYRQRQCLSGRRFPPTALSFLQPYPDFFQHPLVLWIGNKTSPGFPPPSPPSHKFPSSLLCGGFSGNFWPDGKPGWGSAGSCWSLYLQVCRRRVAAPASHTTLFPASCHFKRGRCVFDKQHQT